MCQSREELVELLLALGQLATAAVVDTEAVHDAVDDQEPVLIGSKGLRKCIEKVHLVLVWLAG